MNFLKFLELSHHFCKIKMVLFNIGCFFFSLHYFILTVRRAEVTEVDLSSSSSSSSSSDEEFDPRSDLNTYKEILLTGCPAEKHLEYHDVNHDNKKKRCFCKKLVHHSCFLADASNCR